MIRKQDCYIYGLRERNCAVYFYIGSTKRTVSVRLENHLCNARAERGGNKHLIRKIRAMGPTNVVADVIEVVSEKHRYDREYHWINQLKTQGVNLCNLRMTPAPPRTEWTIEEMEQIFGGGPENDPLLEQLRQAGLSGIAFLKAARAEGMSIV